MKAPESFVPLTAASVPPAPREFRVNILSGHDHDHTSGASAAKPTGFQSLESQRPTSFSSPGGGEKKIGEPRVSIQRDGDRVTHLRIQCPCGQILDLACVYDAPPSAA